MMKIKPLKLESLTNKLISPYSMHQAENNITDLTYLLLRQDNIFSMGYNFLFFRIPARYQEIFFEKWLNFFFLISKFFKNNLLILN